MKSKERLMTAINNGIPDRVPVTVHDWQASHLQKYMNGISDIAAFKKLGMDAAIVRYPFVFRTSDNWKIEYSSKNAGSYFLDSYIIQTPKGKLTYTQGRNNVTIWEMEHLIKNDEDINLLKYRPLPYYDLRAFEKAYDELGDEGIVRTFLCGYQGGCWQEACNLFGLENLILKTYDDPDWVHSLMKILLIEKLEFIAESIRGAKVDLVETGGGAGSSTVISPDIHREFCLPYDKATHDAIAGCGLKTVYHTCGGMTKIADMILQNGCDASETFSPVEIGGDIRGAKDIEKLCMLFKGRVAMIGGFDQINILTNGNKKIIEDEVKKVFAQYGAGGGFVLCACDHFFDASKENLLAFANAAKECVY